MPTGPASHRRTLTLICAVFTLAIVALYLTNGQYTRLEQSGRDWLFTNGKARRAVRDPQIVFLAIDEASRQLDTLFAEDLEKSPALRLMKQGFPYPRAVYGLILDRLVEAGAKVVVFDMLFPSAKEGDEAFRAALEKHRGRVVIGSNLVSKGQEDVEGSLYTGTLQIILPSSSLLSPLKDDHRVGFVNVHQDPDGIVRQVVYRTTLSEFFRGTEGGEELFSLSARALQQAGYGDRIPPGHRSISFRYAEDFLPRSLYEIFVEDQWNAPPYNGGAFFRDKIVIIGAYGQSSEDRLQTPFGVTLGPFIHLNAINAALQGEFIRQAPPFVDISMIALGGTLAWFLGAKIRRPLLRLSLLTLFAASFIQIADWMASSGLLVILFGPLLVLIGSGIASSAWEQILDRVERERTRRTLERYVSKDVVSELLDNPQTYLDSLGGQRKPVTVLFSDIRGFTTLTETADPHALVEQLNEYFGEMVAIVFANHGTLDKFIGDCVMAHWGSITSAGPAEDAERAIITALQMREALVRLNASWKQRGMHEWRFGIGVNSGEPITGNIGAAASTGKEEQVDRTVHAKSSAEKFDFTVIGDAVNLASRLEGTTKEFHIDLCVGEKTAELVRDRFIFRSVALILVKGKTQPVEIFTVLDKRNGAEPAWLARHEEAMRLYRAGDFAGAEKAWREVLAQAPGDGLAEVFVARCLELQANPPKTPWTGVYEMKTK